MDIDYLKVIEVFETNDFDQVNRYLNGGWKQIDYSKTRDTYILVWTNSENKPTHYKSSWDLLKESPPTLNSQDDQEHTPV